ncbi:C2 domain-containing protein 2 [Dufourea novaeangliae]|uniref:C2 domain-containing protein 2 n=1 Tax=Dufourea novaeangliae TaxID=178035 RepID=A0A154PJ19_DUFNO|nr:C2 domain-containing protein 2 [Dufourea novaeangliae]
MLIFGWMVFGLVVLCVGKYVYNRFVLNGAVYGTIIAAKDGHIVHSDSVGGGSGSGGGGGGGGGIFGGSKLLSLGKQKTPSSSPTGSGGGGKTPTSGGAGGGGGAGSGSGSGSSLIGAAHPSGSVATPSGIGGGSPQSYVPPTPPVRKRLTARKTSGALISPARSSRSLHLPTATGADPDAVRWVNEIIVWMYSDPAILDELLAVWVTSLNSFTAKSVDENGVGVEFVRVLPETYPPNLSNIFCECDSKDDVTITCDCEATPALQLKAFRRKADKLEVSHYRVNVNRFRARLNVISITEKLLLDLKCDGWPEVKVSLAPVGTIKKDLDESHLQDVVTEIVVGALRGTSVHLNLFQYPSCPRLWREQATNQPGFSLPMHYDSMSTSSGSQQPPRQQMRTQSPTPVQTQYMTGEKRLLVKVVRATELGGEQGAVEPYCVVELDEPSQKNQTSVKKDTRNPLWDEAFLFDVTRNTTEVLLEVYDRVNKTQRFLGLGIVGVDELLANPSQRQIIPLQGRPYEEDDITGTLTVEFLFIEGAEVPQIGSKPYKVKETIKPVSPTAPRTYNPTNLISDNSLNYNNGNSTLILYDSTVQSEGDYLTNGNAVDSPYRTGQSNGNKGTLIVHSQQRHGPKDTSLTSGPESTPNSSNSEERGRTRRKRRDFFGTIKKRLTRSKTRSRSVGPEGDANHEDAHSRSISADRARDPGSGREEHSRRSSLSEASGISGASTRTYINEASTLVLETVENGIKKHYLVPLSLAQKSKWRKKGTKLHIFNDHTFIAKHMAGFSGTVCEVCKRTLARRLGKQGYECRDCQMKCHKHCHVKVDTTCPTSTIQSIELSLLPVLSE